VNDGRTENFLSVFMFLGMICHGIFFIREWLVLGAVLIFYTIVHWKQVCLITVVAKNFFRNPVSIFLLLSLFSLAGLFSPVRAIDGWLEAFRWLVYLSVYLWGIQLAAAGEANRFLNRMTWLTILAVVLSWLPGSENIWLPPGPPEEGRYAFCFGYPNSAAAFLVCQLMVILRKRKFNPFFLLLLGISILSTGSRASVLLLLLFIPILLLKKRALTQKNIINMGSIRTVTEKRSQVSVGIILFVCLIIVLYPAVSSIQVPFSHLCSWTNTSLAERIAYYADSIRLARDAYFLPQAGGWLGFSFIQTTPYWTLDTHSSFCRVLLNQGIIAVLFLMLWAWQGLRSFVQDLWNGDNLGTICTKAAALFLGLHSLIDVDMSFGMIGILFWLLVGMNTGEKAENQKKIRTALLS